MKNIIAFWGYPAPEIIEKLKNQYPNASWLDLDIDFNYPETNILPDAYCKIIKNVINNAIFLKDKIIKIVATIGKDKCDSGWFAAQVLKDMGFDVIQSAYEDKSNKREITISTSNLPLYEKITKITDNIISPKIKKYEQCKPQFGFWGVPPNDLD